MENYEKENRIFFHECISKITVHASTDRTLLVDWNRRFSIECDVLYKNKELK